MAYDPKTIEPKWQAYWLEKETFKVEIDQGKPKYYVLDMFPYPSGDGLHVGHPEGYTATDILARYKRMRGFNVLHPMGWDAFGLPAEQFAIKTGTHPEITTRRNIDNFKRQIQSLGFSYDWSREIDTTDPSYVKWTQWIFTQLHERGLAYEAEVPVNWCAGLGTVLANEEVIDGKSEVGGFPVTRLPLRQWMLRITDYAERLLEDLDDLEWPEPIKKQQRDWIGRSEGAQVAFEIEGHPGVEVLVFTTRPDTLFGATYLVLAPEHPLTTQIVTDEKRSGVEEYVQQTQRKSERARMADVQEKTGVFTGAIAKNPAGGALVPVWIADYVLSSYGTGAIMAVPGHDERDYAFARTFDLPITEVVTGGDLTQAAYTGEGTSVNSDFLNGLPTPDAKARMIDWLEEHELGERTVTYKLRDWLFSRQRYWGEPFPILHNEDGSVTTLSVNDLPLTLPTLDDYKPSGKDFEAPLSRVRDWVEVTNPATGATAHRDPNTMPQWAGSCWYFLRFLDPHNDNAAWSEEAERYWMPVDLYVGGAEHAVLHLLYARFWHKVFYDIGLVHTKEPFQKLVNQGMILGLSYRYYDDNVTDDPTSAAKVYGAGEVAHTAEGPRAVGTGDEVKERWIQRADVLTALDGKAKHPEHEGLALEEVLEKMSKSRGNVINPDDVVDAVGADSMRLYEMFIGPLDKSAPWSTEGIQGIYRFLQRVWRLFFEESEDGDTTPRGLQSGAGTPEQQKLKATTIKGVTDDLEAMRFNTAISKLMVYARDIEKTGPLTEGDGKALVLLLAPFAPHISEEVWECLGARDTLTYEPWPEADAALLVEDEISIVVQVKGKRRDSVLVPKDASNEAIEQLALASSKVQAHLGGKEPKKIIVVPGRLVNIVV